MSESGSEDRRKPPPQAVTGNERGEPETASTEWQELEARWKTVLGLEATMDTLRIAMEGLLAEMEGAFRRQLTPEERLFAMSADVVQWTKAKSRIHFVLPRAREFVHRATWAKSTPERKRLDDLFKNQTASLIPVGQMDQVRDDLEILRKDRQVLSAQGVTVGQDCKAILAEVQQAVRRLQTNAASRAKKKTGASGAKRKS